MELKEITAIKKELKKLKDLLLIFLLAIKDDPFSGTFIFLFFIFFYGVIVFAFVYAFWGLLIFLILAWIYFRVMIFQTSEVDVDEYGSESLFKYLKMKHSDNLDMIWFFCYPIFVFLLMIYIW